jgi:hypothetical protein
MTVHVAGHVLLVRRAQAPNRSTLLVSHLPPMA